MPTPARLASTPQRELFEALAHCGRLVLAVGPEGVRAHLVGAVRIRRVGLEDRVEIDGDSHHIVVDWRRLKEVEVSSDGGEGLLTFFDGVEPLFRLYRPAGPYPADVARFADATLWPSVAGDP